MIVLRAVRQLELFDEMTARLILTRDYAAIGDVLRSSYDSRTLKGKMWFAVV